MILGSDAAGIDEDGNEVVVHGVVADPRWRGDETLDPKRDAALRAHQGTFADRSPCRGATWCPSRPPLLRGGGVPADGLAHGLPDAVREVAASRPARRCWCRARAVAWRPR